MIFQNIFLLNHESFFAVHHWSAKIILFFKSQDPGSPKINILEARTGIYCIVDDTHLFTYQAAWAKFNTLSQNLSFKPNYNQLSWILTMCHWSKVSPFFTVFSNIHPLTLVSVLTCEWQAQYCLHHSAGSVLPENSSQLSSALRTPANCYCL